MKQAQQQQREAVDTPAKYNTLPSTEEKKRNREEKMKQAQQQREALEKASREKVLKQQQEREEKYRKIMEEKEEKQRMEVLKKKLIKEKQAKKFAEERARKDEFLAPAPKPMDPPSLSKNDSLQIKLQKQILLEKSFQQKKAESKSTYSFEMLHTDDSTDDESKPSHSRPAVPEWSKSKEFNFTPIRCHSNCNFNFRTSTKADHCAAIAHQPQRLGLALLSSADFRGLTSNLPGHRLQKARPKFERNLANSAKTFLKRCSMFKLFMHT